MVCLRFSVIYICLVRVAVDPLKGNNGLAGFRCFFHPLMCSTDTICICFHSEIAEEFKGAKSKKKWKSEVSLTLSEPQWCQTYNSLDDFYNKVLVLVRYETAENFNTVGTAQDAKVEEVRLVPCTSAPTCVVLF